MTLCIPFLHLLILKFIKNQGDLAVNLTAVTGTVFRFTAESPWFFSSLFLNFFSAREPFSGPTDGLGKLGMCALERARFFL